MLGCDNHMVLSSLGIFQKQLDFLIGANMSETHTSELNCDLYIFVCVF